MINFSDFDKPRAKFMTRVIRRVLIMLLVVFGALKWVFYGALVRRNLRKAEQEGRPYFLDRMPGGRGES